MKRIACVFAHPDDETFVAGGTIAKYARVGIPTDLFCATNGDAGKSAAVPVSSRAELAGLRRRELDTAARILGIDAIRFGNHDDGALTAAPTLPDEIAAFLERVRPTVVITFGPEGGPTSHPDHIAICRATTQAFERAGAGARLFYHAWEGRFSDERLSAVSGAVTARIDVRETNAIKEAAFRAHATQQGSARAFYDSAFRDDESYALALGAAQPSALITDLFDGLSD